MLIVVNVGEDRYATNDNDDEGGCWVCIDVTYRSPESKFLMMLTAIAIAKLTESRIWDDDGWTGQLDSVTPEEALATMSSHSTLGFVAEAELRFPDPQNGRDCFE